MAQWQRVHKPSGATVIERHIGNCKLVVIPEDWSDYPPTVTRRGKTRTAETGAVWSVSCGSANSNDFAAKRGAASSVAIAKSSAMAALQKLTRRLVHNAADIETIAKDADKHARDAARSGDHVAAKHWRAEARAVRAQKFEGRRQHQR